ncbi:MAG: hypothetical protein KDH48_08755 [Rhodoferax sp.]|nr:hypothetical protein [Rhodoferax sp.]
MIRHFIRRAANAMGRRYHYDAGYINAMADRDLSMAIKYGLATTFFMHRKPLPASAFWAARLTATRLADCGSCLELVMAMAREEGIGAAELAAVLRGAPAQPDADLGMRFAAGAINRADGFTATHAEALHRYGEAGVDALAIAVTGGQFFPLLKRALGHGNSCSPVLARMQAETARG